MENDKNIQNTSIKKRKVYIYLKYYVENITREKNSFSKVSYNFENNFIFFKNFFLNRIFARIHTSAITKI